MIVIRPVDITDDVLSSISVPETDQPAWGSGTTYSLGQLSLRGHRIWKSLQASNTNHDPLTSPTWWTAIAATNAWAMFDDKVGSLCTATGEIETVLEPGAIDALAILDTNAEAATAEMTVGGDVVYSEIRSTNVGGAAITDWSLYFFEPIGKVDFIIFDDLPIYENAVVTITISAAAPGGTVSAGTLVVGRQLDVGVTGNNAKPGIDDFSKRTTDDFGVTSVAERGWRKRMSLQTKTPSASVDLVYNTMVQYRAKPLVWIGSTRFGCLTIYGTWKRFDPDIQYGDYTFCTFEIEGLTRN